MEMLNQYLLFGGELLYYCDIFRWRKVQSHIATIAFVSAYRFGIAYNLHNQWLHQCKLVAI